MQSVERTVTVDKPIELVWAYLADFTNTEEWDPPTRTTVRESGTGDVGTVYKNTSSMLGKDVEVTYTVTQFEPTRRIQLRGETGSLTLVDTITLEGGRDRTSVTYHAEFHPHSFTKVVEPLMPLGLKRLADKTEDQMEQRLLEL